MTNNDTNAVALLFGIPIVILGCLVLLFFVGGAVFTFVESIRILIATSNFTFWLCVNSFFVMCF